MLYGFKEALAEVQEAYRAMHQINGPEHEETVAADELRRRLRQLAGSGAAQQSPFPASGRPASR